MSTRTRPNARHGGATRVEDVLDTVDAALERAEAAEREAYLLRNQYFSAYLVRRVGQVFKQDFGTTELYQEWDTPEHYEHAAAYLNAYDPDTLAAILLKIYVEDVEGVRDAEDET